LHIAWRFPIWGTGYGTFQFVEPGFRTTPSAALNEHAHNEYLEAAAEGGIVRFALTLLAVALVMRLGFRAFRRQQGTPAGSLLLGALFGLSTVVLHSGVEFGLHVPAIAILVTSVAALLCALASPAPGDERNDPAHAESAATGRFSLSWYGTAPALAALTLLLLAATIVSHGWIAAKVQILRRSAARFSQQSDTQSRGQWIAYLKEAVATEPGLARVRIELARAHQEVLELETERLNDSKDLDDAARAATLQQMNREHTLAALQQYVVARDLCPVLGEPHLEIAANVGYLLHADSAATYLERAQMLMPHDPKVWYASGLQQLLDGNQPQAWQRWRRSLELSELFLPEIAAAATGVLDDTGLIADVLPPRADLLVRTAFYRYPNADQEEKRRPFLEAARTLLASDTAGNTAADTLYIEATAHRSVREWERAIERYRAALNRQPGRVDWRYELAELLFEQQRANESRDELVIILRQQPDHERARQLYHRVVRNRYP
jgi:tetratricopeptide (TPR) repeat protein